jgi:hypothetical protein
MGFKFLQAKIFFLPNDETISVVHPASYSKSVGGGGGKAAGV